jgi:hypothetical protein
MISWPLLLPLGKLKSRVLPYIYIFTTKLRLLKTELKQLHRQHTIHITSRVIHSRDEWNTDQSILAANPTSSEATDNERATANHYMQLCKDEESFFWQKSRIQWLQLGDKNTNFFHKSLLHRQVRNHIHSLMDATGTLIHDQMKLGKMTVSFFEQLHSHHLQPTLHHFILAPSLPHPQLQCFFP